MPETSSTTLAYVRVSSAGGNVSIFEVRRSPAYIGTDAACDVALRADGKNAIDPRHAQLLALPDGRFRLVNLSQQTLAVRSATEQLLTARNKVDLVVGDCVTIGAFELQILASMEQASALPRAMHDAQGNQPRKRKSDLIGLQLTPQTTTSLAEGQKLPITVSIKNKGEAERVKFEVAVIGVDAAFYEANDGPVLGPHEEGDILLTIMQPALPQARKLTAGDLDIRVRVTAAPYANQPAEDCVTIHVLPVYLCDIEEAAG